MKYLDEALHEYSQMDLDEALHEYSQMDFYPFHMPGHKRNFLPKIKRKINSWQQSFMGLILGIFP